MPITDDEWAAGRLDPRRSRPPTTPVGEGDGETDRVRSFLGRNADRAFTAREIRRGVTADESDDADAARSAGASEGAADAVVEEGTGDVDGPDVQAVLDDLVEEGAVVAKDIDTDDGSETYYRLNTGDEQVEG